MGGRFVLAAAVTTVVAFVAAGCGGGTSAGAGSAAGGAASVVPADSVAFVAIDSDLGSSQWQALDGLFANLPGGGLISRLRAGVEQKTGLSWANDVQPALGPELDVAVLPAAGGKPQAVLLTQPAGQAKLDALLAKLGANGTAPVSATVDGWTAISDSQAALDAVSGAASHLDASSLYQDATAKLAAGALATVYANGAEARQLVSALGGTVSASPQLDWAAADVVAASGGLKVDGFVRSEGGTPTQPYDAALTSRIPSGQLFVADFQASHDSAATSTPASPLLGDLGAIGDALGGETALYVSPASPLPAVTLVTQADRPQQAVAAIEQALADAGKSAGAGLGSFLGALALSHATVGSDLVVSTSQQQIDAFESGGRKLADDGGFRAARSASGMPDRTSGFVYVNLKDALPALSGLAALAGGSNSGGTTLPSGLQSLTAFGGGSDGGVSTFTVYLAVQ